MPSLDPPWSQLGLAEDQAIYASPTQNVRAVSEHWAAASLFCPACGTAPLDKARAKRGFWIFPAPPAARNMSSRRPRGGSTAS